MKFIHAADLHLDSPLRGLSQYAGAPVEDLRGATRRAFENLIALAIEEQVNFVLIAGDVYDGDWKDYNTGLFFRRGMSRLREAGIRVFVIRGNHDARSVISRDLRLPDNVHEFSTKAPETRVLEEFGVAVHGQGFPTQAVTEDLSASYPAAIAGLFNIGLLHTSATGRDGHENYAPCSVEGLIGSGYDYWALGHVHGREQLKERPHILFPGNIQGRHARETGDKGCTLVEVIAGQLHTANHRRLDVVQWSVCEVDATGARTEDDVLERIQRKSLDELQRADRRLLAMRLVISGPCALHNSFLASSDRWENEVRSLLTDYSGGQIWLEKLSVRTRTMGEPVSPDRHEDAIGQLLAFLRAVPTDAGLLADLLEEFRDLRLYLPAGLNFGDESRRLDDAELVKELLIDVENDLMARLFMGEGVA